LDYFLSRSWKVKRFGCAALVRGCLVYVRVLFAPGPHGQKLETLVILIEVGFGEVPRQPMRATEFEFRYRFWLIVLIFSVGFWLYAIDHVNAGEAVAQWIAGHVLQSQHMADRSLLRAVFGCGALVVILAALIRTWAAAYLQSKVVHDSNLHAETLVADGPYRYVRNPLYLGGVLLAVGFGLLASRLGFAFIVAAMSLLYYRLIRREEAALLETQGQSYRQFLATVPRLIPSLQPRVPSAGAKPRWGQAFLGETFMWLFAFTASAFAATLSAPVFYISLGLSLAGYWLAMVLVSRRRRKAVLLEKSARH
jgi:protein-S-isoprenylcysteine O-methyltransferase Ste14